MPPLAMKVCMYNAQYMPLPHTLPVLLHPAFLSLERHIDGPLSRRCPEL